MKINNRNIGLVLIVVLVISVLSACTPKTNEPVDNEVLLQNAGFTAVKTVKDGKSFIEIGVNNDNLTLEVVDKEIFDGLEEDEFYIFTYNSDNVLKSINENSYLKSLVLNSMELGNEPVANTISPVDKVSLENLTLLDEYEFDFDGDNKMEKVNMYTSAQKDENGEIMWDDGQRWLFVVHNDDKDYVLFDDYVQIGSIKSYVYTIDEQFYIASMTTATANLTLKSYLYDSETDTFIENTPFDTEGNVNMLHSTFGY